MTVDTTLAVEYRWLHLSDYRNTMIAHTTSRTLPTRDIGLD